MAVPEVHDRAPDQLDQIGPEREKQTALRALDVPIDNRPTDDTVTKLEYDLYYIKNISPSLELYIVFHTLKTMILTRGAQ